MNYYISHSGTHNYFKVSSITLRGAKIMATKCFELAANGYIEVLEDSPHLGNPPVRVSVKYSTGRRWIDHN